MWLSQACEYPAAAAAAGGWQRARRARRLYRELQTLCIQTRHKATEGRWGGLGEKMQTTYAGRRSRAV